MVRTLKSLVRVKRQKKTAFFKVHIQFVNAYRMPNNTCNSHVLNFYSSVGINVTSDVLGKRNQSIKTHFSEEPL